MRVEPGLRDLGLAVTVTDPAMGVKNRKTIYRKISEFGIGVQVFKG